ncbi:MAG TPA: hypothetical protein PLQ32_06060, partial [Flavihumibacter sp.]|nr:hypothetical protein [Flavihumibacter sp.]
TLQLLTQVHYSQPCPALSQATIGQHTRHIIEMFQCLLLGYETGIINYEKRQRNKSIETDRLFAMEKLNEISAALSRENKELLMEASYREDTDEMISLQTNFYREIAYNLEHTIHHMALIKVGVLQLTDLELPAGFGVASSTTKFKQACAR